MAFKQRNKNNGIEEVDEVGSVNIESSKKSKNSFIPERKTFKEQAIEVIKILQDKGIDIYDESRTPGMYLKNSKRVNKNILNFLGGNNTQNQHNQQNSQNQEDIAPKNLIDFLSKK